MIMIACARWIDAHPSFVVVRGIVEFETNGLTRNGLQNLNRFIWGRRGGTTGFDVLLNFGRSLGRLLTVPDSWRRVLASWGTRMTPVDIFPYAFTRGNTDLSTGMRSIEDSYF